MIDSQPLSVNSGTDARLTLTLCHLSNNRIPMEEKPVRGPGGRLALWALYLFCFYSLWAVLRYFWVVSSVEPPPGSGIADALGERMFNALLGLLVLGTVGSILGVIVWITRPRVY